MHFAVRAGNIYFVATNGNDSNTGSFSAQWKTILKAKNPIAPGDSAYLEDGVTQTSHDNFNAGARVSARACPQGWPLLFPVVSV